MKLTQGFLEIFILLISLTNAQLTKPRDLLDGIPNPFAPASSPSAAPAAPPPPQCRCTIVFGDKSSLTVNRAVVSTNGISGGTAGKKACTAQLFLGTGCSAAILSESQNNYVKSEACITALVR
jgi:hypothetical protein